MRQFIREHPWRLEIVPFLIFMSTAILLLIDRRNTVNLQQDTQNWPLNYAVQFSLLLFAWSIQSATNHVWVQIEKRKMFNASVVIWNGMMVIFGLPIIRPSVGIIIASAVFVSLLIAGILIELTRPFIPRANRPDKTTEQINIRPAERFYYRETNINWALAGPWIIFAFFIGLMVWEATGRWWIGALTIIVQFLAANAFPRSTMTITNEKIITRQGIKSKIFKLENITACEPVEYEPSEQGKSLAISAYILSPHRIWIWTADGKAHSISVSNPEKICEMIRIILSNIKGIYINNV